MRTITAAQQGVLDSGNQSEHVRVSIKDTGGTWRDLSTYPGFNAVKTVAWNEQIDSPHMVFDIVLLREMNRLSLSPYLTASAVNKGFNTSGPFDPLIALTRELKIEVAVVRMDSQPLPGDWVEFFRGRIDELDAASSANVKIGGRGLGGRLAQQFIRTEYVYSYASVAGVSKPLRIWEPQIPVVLNTTYCLPASRAAAVGTSPADPGFNKFFKCSQTGTTGTSEPTWTTGTNINDGTAKWDYVAAPTTAGNPVEQIMQNILTDHKSASDVAVTLYTPATPGWAIRQFIQSREFVLDAITKLATQIGWDLRYKWRAATSQFELTFASPGSRTAPTVVFTFAAGDYELPTQLAVNISNIRNSWRGVYSDRADLWPDGSPKRKVIEVSDATSIAKYGELWAEIQEDENSQVDTTAEMTALLNAALSDCKEPTAEIAIPLVRGFPWVEINDYYTFLADNLHFDYNQSLAVVGWAQSFEAGGRLKTTLQLRGYPTIGASRWLGRSEHPLNPHAELPHQLAAFNGTQTQNAHLASEVGGQSLRLTQTRDKNRISHDDAEVHVYVSSGQALDGTTLKTVVKGDGVVTMGDLVPGKQYYARVVPRSFNHQRIIRGQPSAEVSFIAGRAKAGHYDSGATPGLLPLNGNFEHTSDADVSPPDHWAVQTTALFGDSGPSPWGEDGGAFLALDASKGNYVYLYTGGTAHRGVISSSRFPIRRGSFDVNFYVSIRKDSSSAAANDNLHMLVELFSTFAGAAIATHTFDFSASAAGAHPTPATWYDLAFAMDPTLLPINSAANFIKLTFYRGTTAPDDFGSVRWDIGDVFCETTGQFSGRYQNLAVLGTSQLSNVEVNGALDIFGGPVTVQAPVDFQDAIDFSNVATSGFTHIRATRATAQTINNAVDTILIFPTEVFDTLAEYDPATGRATIVRAGYYRVEAAALFEQFAAAVGTVWQMALYKNGTVVSQGARPVAETTLFSYRHVMLADTILLAASDVIDIRIFQNTGAARTTFPGAIWNYLNIHRIL